MCIDVKVATEPSEGAVSEIQETGRDEAERRMAEVDLGTAEFISEGEVGRQDSVQRDLEIATTLAYPGPQETPTLQAILDAHPGPRFTDLADIPPAWEGDGDGLKTFRDLMEMRRRTREREG